MLAKFLLLPTLLGGVSLAEAPQRQARLVVQGPHAAEITAVALSEDGRLAASGDAQGCARLWQVSTGAALLHVDLPAPVLFVAVSDGQLVVGTADAVQAWDPVTGGPGVVPEFVRPQKTPVARPEGVPAELPAALSEDGAQLIVATEAGGLLVVDPEGRRGGYRLAGGAEPLAQVAWDARGLFLLEADGGLSTWSPTTGQPSAEVDLKVAAPGALAWTADLGSLLLGREDGPAQLFDLRTGVPLHSFSGHDKPVMSVSISPGGNRLVSGAADGSVMLWNLEAMALERALPAHDSQVRAVAWSPDKKLLASGAAEVHVVRALDGRILHTLGGHEGPVVALAFSPNGELLLTGDEAGLLRAWDVQSGQLRYEQRVSGSVEALAWMPQGHRFLVAHGGKLELRAKKEGGLVGQVADLGVEVTRLHVAPARSALYVGDKEGRVTAFDLNQAADTWTPDWEIQAQRGPIKGLDLHADGHTLVTMSTQGGVRYWSARSGRAKGRGQTRPVTAGQLASTGSVMALGRSGGNLGVWAGEGKENLGTLDGDGAPAAVVLAGEALWVTGSENGRVRMWDPSTRTSLQVLDPRTDDAVSAEGAVRALGQSPDGAWVAFGWEDGALALWRRDSPAVFRQLDGFDVSVEALGAAGGRLWAASAGGALRVYDPSTGAVVLTPEALGAPIDAMAVTANGTRVAVSAAGEVRVLDAKTGERIATLAEGHGVTSLAFSPDGAQLLMARSDAAATIWSVEAQRRLCTLVSMEDGGWLIVDDAGRFDVDGAGGEGARWVLEGEVLAMEQLRARYYDPGLLAKALGQSAEPLLQVQPLDGVELYPEVTVREPEGEDTTLVIELVNRGGGIGEVWVTLNGSDITAAVARPSADPNVDQLTLTVDLAALPYYQPSGENRVEVQAFNASGFLSSRGASTAFMDELLGDEDAGPPPHFWAVVIGSHDYKGDKLDLRYPAKDAQSMATALGVASKQLFGEENTHITLMTTAEGDTRPSIEAIEAAFAELQRAQPQDLILVYLAGHGTTYDPGDGADYFYLAPEFGGFEEIEDAEVRATRALSGTRMQELLLQSPAGKRVLILDTCASGALVDTLDAGASRAAPPGQARALQRMQDRTGTYVLAGAAADAVSYETTRYGQGVLTYALLEGMRGAAVEGNHVDVSTLFEHARDRVPELAEGIGGIQRPVLKQPSGGSFDIGLVDDAAREAIPLQMERPVVVRANFRNVATGTEDVALGEAVNVGLRDQAYAPDGALAYFNTASYPGGYQLSGSYLQGASYTLTARLIQGEDTVVGFRLEEEGAAQDPVLLAGELVLAVNAWFADKDPESLLGRTIGDVEILDPQGVHDATEQLSGRSDDDMSKALRWLTRGGPCMEPTDRVDLSMALGTARLSYNRGNLVRFEEAISDIEDALACMSEPLQSEDILALHRVYGLRAWSEGATDTSVAYLSVSKPSAAELALAEREGPEDEYDVLAINRTAVMNFDPGSAGDVPQSARGRVTIDGQGQLRALPAEAPYVLQRATSRRILDTQYVHPGGEIPHYPRTRRVLLGTGLVAAGVTAGTYYGAWATHQQLDDDPELPNRLQADCSGWSDAGVECFETGEDTEALQRRNNALAVTAGASAVVAAGSFIGLGLSFVW